MCPIEKKDREKTGCLSSLYGFFTWVFIILGFMEDNEGIRKEKEQKLQKILEESMKDFRPQIDELKKHIHELKQLHKAILSEGDTEKRDALIRKFEKIQLSVRNFLKTEKVSINAGKYVVDSFSQHYMMAGGSVAGVTSNTPDVRTLPRIRLPANLVAVIKPLFRANPNKKQLLNNTVLEEIGEFLVQAAVFESSLRDGARVPQNPKDTWPMTPAVKGVFTYQGITYLVMEDLCSSQKEGNPRSKKVALQDFLREKMGIRSNTNDTLGFLFKLAAFFDTLHGSIWHRDIKPSNLYVEVNNEHTGGFGGSFRVIDWGTCQVFSSKQTHGTEGYVHPDVMGAEKQQDQSISYLLELKQRVLFPFIVIFLDLLDFMYPKMLPNSDTSEDRIHFFRLLASNDNNVI